MSPEPCMCGNGYGSGDDRRCPACRRAGRDDAESAMDTVLRPTATGARRMDRRMTDDANPLPYYDERDVEPHRTVKLPRCSELTAAVMRLLDAARLSGTVEPIVSLLLDDESVADDQRLTLCHHLACHPRGASLIVHLLHRADKALQLGAKAPRAVVLQRLLQRLRELDVDISDPRCHVEWTDE